MVFDTPTGIAIILTGPIACGKTTERELLRQLFARRGRLSISFGVSPFSGSNRMILSFLKAIIIRAHPEYVGDPVGNLDPMGVLERTNKRLLTKILLPMGVVDIMQGALLVLAVSLLTRLGLNMFIEDFTPVMILEHLIYLSPNGTEGASRSSIGHWSYKVVGTLTRRYLNGRAVCVYLYASPQVRVARSRQRGNRTADPFTLHDAAYQDALRKLVQQTYVRTLVIQTDQMTVPEVSAEMMSRIREV